MAADKPSAEPEPATSTTNNEPRIIRITNHGKIHSWVAKSLEFLQENPDRPLVFHTLPFSGPSSSSDGASKQDTAGKETDKETDKAKEPDAPLPNQQQQTQNTTKVVPRLISVVEIIKREYIKLLDKNRSLRTEGLHQYNEVQCLEEDDALNPVEGNDAVEGENKAEERAREIAAALNGKNFVKQKQTPYLRITLSLSEMPELVVGGATYQPPSKRKLSKRVKQKAKKATKLGQSA